MITIARCLVVGLGLGLGLDLVSSWLVVMHTYLCTTFGCYCHTADWTDSVLYCYGIGPMVR